MGQTVVRWVSRTQSVALLTQGPPKANAHATPALSLERVGDSVAQYCPTCRGIMRPTPGGAICIRCTQSGRARTVLSQGRRITLGKGQMGLGALPQAASSFDRTLAPQAPSWQGSTAGAPHPQLGLFPFDKVRDGQLRLTRDVTIAVQGGRHLVAQAPTGLGKTAAGLAPALAAAMSLKKTVLFLTSRQSQHRIAIETLRSIQEHRGVHPVVVDLVAKRDMCLRPEASEMHPGRFPDFCASETRNKTCQFLGEVGQDTLQQVRRGVLHVEELMHASKAAQLCPHLVAMTAAPEAHVVVADYNHLFSDIREQSLERIGRELSDLIVIVDEAHNLPERIRQSHSHKVTGFLLSQTEAEARGERAGEAEQDLRALRRAMDALASAAREQGRAQPARLGSDERQVAQLHIEELHAAFDSARNQHTLGMHRTLAQMVESLRALVSKVKKGSDQLVHAEELADALEDWGRFRNGALRFLEWDTGGAVELHVRLLDPSIPARMVFEKVHSAILMSGTLRPPEMVRDLLGLDAARTTVRTYPSPFDPANRLVVVAQGYTTRYQSRDQALWDRIAGTLADVAKGCKGNLAVFAPSYAILGEVRAALEGSGHGKLLIVEEPGLPKSERDRVLDTLEGARRRNGAILMGVVGGSFSEGVDFKGNLLSVVAVVGLPLAPPDLEVEAGIAYLESKFPGQGRAYGYTYPAMNKVLQAMGRAIRSETDKCAILLLDERYLGPPYRGLLPPLQAATDPAAVVKPFLAAHGL